MWCTNNLYIFAVCCGFQSFAVLMKSNSERNIYEHFAWKYENVIGFTYFKNNAIYKKNTLILTQKWKIVVNRFWNWLIYRPLCKYETWENNGNLKENEVSFTALASISKCW